VKEQGLSFDEVAGLYDRLRPGYPEPLFDDLVSLAAVPPGARMLEIGCGTGQATLPLARRGHRVRCLEPGSALARGAREKLSAYPEVEVCESTFEDWSLERSAFDLIFSAQAFHWVSAEVRFAKAAEALTPAGSLAVFGNAVVPDSSPLGEAIDAVYARHAPALRGPSPTHWYRDEGPLRNLYADSGRFGPVAHRSHPWSRRYSASEYCDLLRTHSDHRLLSAAERGALFGALSAQIEAHGSGIDVAYEAHLYVAPRKA